MSLPDGIIRERTRQYWVTADPFMWMAGSFQYAENLNVFDDPRGIKLTTGREKDNTHNSCKLVSAGDYIVRIPTPWDTAMDVKKIAPSQRPSGWTVLGTVSPWVTPYDAVIFNGSVAVIWTKTDARAWIYFYDLSGSGKVTRVPVDNTWDTPVIMWNQDPNLWELTPPYCNCICNLNNSMLLVGNGNYLRAYNPAEDAWSLYASGWKIVKRYSGDCNIVEISPKADYVELFIDDGFWNTKIHYYPWIFDMEDSGLMKSVDLPNTRIQRVYPHMTKEMMIISLDWSNNNVSLREVIWYETYPVMKSHRAWLSPYDVQHKLWFFTWPCGYDMVWYDGRAYVADVEWIWEFNWYDAKKMPVGTLRWKFYNESQDKTPFGLAIAKDYIFVSYNDAEYCARIYDTVNPYWYAKEWMLISRAIETEYGGEFTKQLVRWITQFEMNNLTNDNGSIDVYVCGNREWNTPNDDAWIKIAHIQQSDADFSNSWNTVNGLTEYNIWTCVHRFDNAGDWSFMQDRQVIEYKIEIKAWTKSSWIYYSSPVLRSLLLEYDVKEKTNYF